MNVMSSMRGGDGFRVPFDAVCTSRTAPGSASVRRRLAANAGASEERQRLHTPRRVKTHTDIVRRLVGSSTQIVPSTMRPNSRSNCLKESN